MSNQIPNCQMRTTLVHSLSRGERVTDSPQPPKANVLSYQVRGPGGGLKRRERPAGVERPGGLVGASPAGPLQRPEPFPRLLRKAQPAWVSLAASPHSRRWSAQRSGGPSWLSWGAGRPQPPPGEDQRAAPRENLRALRTALMALGLGLKEAAVQEPGLPVFFPFQLSSPSLL